jgi:hypothetical protein
MTGGGLRGTLQTCCWFTCRKRGGHRHVSTPPARATAVHGWGAGKLAAPKFGDKGSHPAVTTFPLTPETQQAHILQRVQGVAQHIVPAQHSTAQHSSMGKLNRESPS